MESGISNRCEICDYTESDGSIYADRAPGQDRKVRWSKRFKKHLCLTCLVMIYECVEVEDHDEVPTIIDRDFDK